MSLEEQCEAVSVETPAHKLWREGIARAKNMGIMAKDKLV